MGRITNKIARVALGVGFCVAAAAFSLPATAAVVLDQKVVVPVGTGIVGALIGERTLPGLSGSYAFSGAQTFTAGVAGILDHIDFQAFNRDPFSAPSIMKLSLIDGDYAAGARDVLLTTEVSSDMLPEGPAAAMGELGLSFDTVASVTR